MRFPNKKAIVYGASSVTVCCLFYISISYKYENEEPPSLTPRNFSIVELMGSRDFEEVVKPGQNTTVMQPSLTSDGIRHFALCLVTSTAGRFEERQAVRNTWARLAVQLDVQVYFTIGVHGLTNDSLLKNLTEEQRVYDDLIIEDFEDTYYRLSVKMLRMLKWYNATFSEATSPVFLIKTDDDIFVKLPAIVDVIQESDYYNNFKALSSSTAQFVNILPDPTSPDSYYIGGKKHVNATLDLRVNSKWHLTAEELEALSWKGPGTGFPPYVRGGFYVLSGNVVAGLYRASFEVPIFPFEDVFLTGMVASDKLGLASTNMDGLWIASDPWPWKKTKSLLVLHPANPTLMFEICANYAACSCGSDYRTSGGYLLLVVQGLFFLLIPIHVNLFLNMLLLFSFSFEIS